MKKSNKEEIVYATADYITNKYIKTMPLQAGYVIGKFAGMIYPDRPYLDEAPIDNIEGIVNDAINYIYNNFPASLDTGYAIGYLSKMISKPKSR